MADTSLQILVTAVDEASETLSAVADNLNEVASGASEVGDAASVASDGLSQIGNDGYDAASGLGSVADAAPAAADAVSTIGDNAAIAADGLAAIGSEGPAAADGLAAVGENGAAAADGLAATADEGPAAAGGLNGAAVGANALASGLSAVALMAVAGPLSKLANDVLDPVGTAIADAAGKSATLAQGLNEITNVINAASGPNAQNATQIADLKAKIEGYRASIAEATATLDTHTGSAIKSAAAHEKAAASIAADQANLQKYQNELDALTNKQDLAGASASGISGQFQALAEQNTSLGVSFEDSYNALVGFFNQTGSVSEATLAYNDALGLSLGHNMAMTDATNAVTQAFNGMGRGLQKIVPDLKDGVAGSDALNQIWTVVQGSVPIAMQELAVQTAALGTNLQELGATAASGLVPQLTTLLTHINDLIQKTTDWADAHPQLAKNILAVAGALSLLISAIASAILLISPFLLLIKIVGAAALATAAPFLALAALIVVLATLIIVNWTQLKNDFIAIGQIMSAAWDSLGNNMWAFIQNMLKQIKALVHTELSDVAADWNVLWQGMSDFVGKIWGTIQNNVKSGVNGLITILNGMINAIDSLHINVPAITIPGTKMGTPALNLGFNLPDIPMLASGGIVYDPVLAMIGEQGPEAVVPLSSFGGGAAGGIGGGSPINIYIQGGIFPVDQSTIKQIGDMLAKQIVRQIKTHNYAS